MNRRRPEQRRRRGGAAGALALLAALLLAGTPAARAADAGPQFSGRVSLQGTVARPGADDAGGGAPRPPASDQQGLRLMLQGRGDGGEGSLHLAGGRSHWQGLPAAGRASSDRFRWRRLGGSQTRGDGLQRSTRLGWEVDRAVWQQRAGAFSWALGRQAIDWGSGRFWQPLNVFGAFAPTELDSDHKPGIDAAALHWYPGDFSSLSAVLVASPRGDAAPAPSGALHYRGSLGERGALALLAARVLGRQQWGAAWEGDWRGTGWRVEALHSRPDSAGQGAAAPAGEAAHWFWIAGIDHRFASGLLLTAEWHEHGRGASRVADLPRLAADPWVRDGLQQQLGRRVLGLSLQQSLSPLLQGSLTLLASPLRDGLGARRVSLLGQFSLRWSLDDESDLLGALVLGSGAGLDSAGQPRSAYGAVPAALSLRWRRYF